MGATNHFNVYCQKVVLSFICNVTELCWDNPCQTSLVSVKELYDQVSVHVSSMCNASAGREEMKIDLCILGTNI